jgi:hypothetical protein
MDWYRRWRPRCRAACSRCWGATRPPARSSRPARTRRRGPAPGSRQRARAARWFGREPHRLSLCPSPPPGCWRGSGRARRSARLRARLVRPRAARAGWPPSSRSHAANKPLRINRETKFKERNLCARPAGVHHLGPRGPAVRRSASGCPAGHGRRGLARGRKTSSDAKPLLRREISRSRTATKASYRNPSG